ncbi:MAG: UDP-N-acetylglucosamine 1-carboxyvinyltransferase, partial [Candidatus Omnitrophica bacterium]|nr:UDP-N-acetylglucosamine 1-carboxyvinyltransferase [Candidatus Omnitrophota bacterium]
TDKVYPDRFMHIAELNRMGANIRRDGPNAIVQGIKKLYGAPVMASDLRASAALIVAGLAAKGRTEIHRMYHLERGYEALDEKLAALGAKVYREEE